LKRVIVVAQQDIKPGEEITYDYQFPIELDLSQRIPCSCGATKCRGYMNWDINDSISSIKQQDKKKVTGRKSRSEN
jgi:sporulation-control protein spo0M